MHEYKNSKLCKGFNVYYLPCEYIETCKLCTNYALDTRQGNNNELHMVFGCAYACKRDNPDFVPYTKPQIYEMYEKHEHQNMTFEELWEYLVEMGIAENEHNS